MNRTHARLLVLVTGDVAVLAGLHPQWGAVAAGVARPHAWLATAGADPALAAVCGVLLWLAAAWIALGLLAGLGVRLPGLAGRLCGRCVRVVLPRVLFRVVLGSTGLGLLAVPAAHAATPAPGAPAAAVISTTTAAPASTSWVHPSNRLADPGSEKVVPSPTWPVGAASAAPQGGRSDPAPTPPTSARPVARVQAGDSLWLLAAHRLGADADAHDIARYWPQLYAANQDVIGDDPSVIRPGQVLHLPAPTTQETR